MRCKMMAARPQPRTKVVMERLDMALGGTGAEVGWRIIESGLFPLASGICSGSGDAFVGRMPPGETQQSSDCHVASHADPRIENAAFA